MAKYSETFTNETLRTAIEDYKATAEGVAEDSKILRFIAETFNKSRCRLDDLEPDIKRNREYYNCDKPKDYWDQAGDSEDIKSGLYRSNLASSFVDLMAAMLTDSRPTFKFTCNFKENLDRNKPEVLQRMQIIENDVDSYFKDWWQQSDMQSKLYIANKDCLIDKKTWGNMYIDKRGKIVFENVGVLFAPEDYDASNRESRLYQFYAKAIRCREIERMFNLKKDSVIADPICSEGLDDKTNKYEVAKAFLVEAYWYDDRALDLQDVAGGEVTKVPMFKYGWRQITFIANQDTDSGIKVISDVEWQYPDIPIVDLILFPITDREGKAFIEQLAPLMSNADMAMQLAMANLRTSGQDKIVYEEGAFTDPDNLTNEVGLKIPVTHVNGIQLVKGNAGVEQGMLIHDKMWNQARELTGISHSLEGAITSDSARAISQLNNAAQMRYRPAGRNNEAWLDKLACIWGYFAFEVMKRGLLIRYDKNFQSVKVLDYDLAEYVESLSSVVVADTSMPRDNAAMKTAMLDLISKAPQLSLAAIQLFCEIWQFDEADQIIQLFTQERDFNGQMQQLQDAVEKMQKFLADLQKQNEQLAAENEKLMMQQMAEVHKGEVALEIEKSRSERDKLKMDVDMYLSQMSADITEQSNRLKALTDMMKIKSQSTESEADKKEDKSESGNED